MAAELDNTNRKIITLLQKQPTLTQSEVAKKIGISQSAVALRLRKLKDAKIFTLSLGIDPREIGMQMARIDASTDGPNVLIDFAKSCPLCANASMGVGDRNVSLLFVSEDIEMFQYIVDSHIRKVQGVSDVSFSPILSWANGFATQIPFEIQKAANPPCGMLPYCPRCPANPSYNGRIFDGYPQAKSRRKTKTNPQRNSSNNRKSNDKRRIWVTKFGKNEYA